MNKDFLKTALFAFFVAMVFVFVLFEIKDFKSEEDIKEEKARLVYMDLSDVEEVTFKSSLFKKEGLVWKMFKPFSDLVDAKHFEEWLSKIMVAKGSKLNTKNEKIKWSDFYFSKESPSVKIKTKNQEVEIFLAEKEAFDESSYLRVRKGDEDGLYVAQKNMASFFEKSRDLFRSRSLFDWTELEPDSRVAKIVFLKKGKVYFSLLRKEGRWQEEGQNKREGWSWEEGYVDSFLDDLKKYKIESFEGKDFKIKDSEKSLTVKTTTGKKYSLYLDKVKGKALAQSTLRPNIFFEVNSDALKALFPAPLDFRSDKDVLGESFEPVSVKIEKGRDKKEFFLESSIWKSAQKKDKKFNGALVFKFVDKVKGINFVRFIEKKKYFFKNQKKKITFKDAYGKSTALSLGQKVQCKKDVKNLKTAI